MEIIVGRKTEELGPGAFARLISGYRELWLDLGSGDGVFVYDSAKDHPDALVVGVDANRDNLRHYSAKARRKAVRGGLPNALYAIAPVERLPRELDGRAARVFINFPWGSLLRAVVEPAEPVLEGIARAGADRARLSILLNYTLFGDAALIGTLRLPQVTSRYVDDVLRPAYARAGIALTAADLLAPDQIPYRTEWGQKLTVSGARETLRIEGTIRLRPDS